MSLTSQVLHVIKILEAHWLKIADLETWSCCCWSCLSGNIDFVQAATPSSAPRETPGGTPPTPHWQLQWPMGGLRPELAEMRSTLFIPCLLVDLNREHRALVATGSHLPHEPALVWGWCWDGRRSDRDNWAADDIMGCWWHHSLLMAPGLELLPSRFQLFSDLSF